MQTFRVLSLNIRACTGNDLRLDADRVAGLVRASAADLVGLQEVDRRSGRSGGVDQAAHVAKAAGLQDFYIPSFPFDGGLFGNAILCRYEVDRFATLRYERRSDEPRSAGVLRTRVSPDAPWFWFATTHLGLDVRNGEPLAQSRELSAWLGELVRDEPLIVTGDLNETPEQEAPQRLAGLWTDVWESLGDGPGWTWSSAEPCKRIDYVYHSAPTTQPAPRAVAVELLDTDATDHRGVLATFAFD